MWKAIYQVIKQQITSQGSSAWGHLFLKKSGLRGACVHIMEKKKWIDLSTLEGNVQSI